MSKQPPPAPTARAVGPCPTLIQTSRTPRHWKFTQDHRTTRPPSVTFKNVAKHFGISYGTAQDIMSNKLGMRRVSARWVPRLLLPEQMGVRVKMCNENCRKYNDEGDTFLNRVVTCAETWIHFLNQIVSNRAQYGSILLRLHRQKH